MARKSKRSLKPQPNRKRVPTAHDKMVGNNVRMLRLRNDMTQLQLGEKLGLSFQQVQKYERGKNRLNGEKLQQIAEIFGVSIPSLMNVSASPGDGDGGIPIVDKQSFTFMQDFQKLPPKVRAALVALILEILKKNGE